MSRFTTQEVVFLRGHVLGRLATVSPAGKPHVVPVRYRFDPQRETIKIGGRSQPNRGQDRLYVRHLLANPHAAFVVDDVPDDQDWLPRGVLIKGDAVRHTEGGEALGPGCGPQWIEISPTWSKSWNLGTAPSSAGAEEDD
jgi:pyridoxamine 5'-phosphate oxidase family protein